MLTDETKARQARMGNAARVVLCLATGGLYVVIAAALEPAPDLVTVLLGGVGAMIGFLCGFILSGWKS